MQREPDTLGTSHLVALRRGVCFFAAMAGVCAVLGAAAVGLPALTSDDGDKSTFATLFGPAPAGSFGGLVGADERLFAQTR